MQIIISYSYSIAILQIAPNIIFVRSPESSSVDSAKHNSANNLSSLFETPTTIVRQRNWFLSERWCPVKHNNIVPRGSARRTLIYRITIMSCGIKAFQKWDEKKRQHIGITTTLPSSHHYWIEGFMGAHKWATIMPRDASLSGSHCNFFISGS